MTFVGHRRYRKTDTRVVRFSSRARLQFLLDQMPAEEIPYKVRLTLPLRAATVQSQIDVTRRFVS